MFSNILGGANVHHVVNKRDVKGGHFIQVYATEDKIDELIASQRDLIQSVSPLPNEMKIDPFLRASARVHPIDRTGEEKYTIDMHVFLADGVRNTEVVANDIEEDTGFEWKVVTHEFLSLNKVMTLSRMEKLAQIISMDPRVLRVTVRPQMELWNHFGSMVLQGGTLLSDFFSFFLL